MNIGQIISLTTKGYKPSDIKELADLANDQPDVIKLAESQKSMEDVKALLELTKLPEPEAKQADTPESEEPAPAAEVLKENEKLKEDLKKAQAQNTSKDLSDNVPTQEELLNSFLDTII